MSYIINQIFGIFLVLTLFSLTTLINCCYAENMNNDMVLKSGISLVESVPQGLIGTWHVSAKLEKSDSSIFKSSSLDIWNLSRDSNVIKLENPFSGAKADVRVDYVSGNNIKFTKIGNYDTKRLTDVVELRLNGDKFYGINKLKLESLSSVDGSVIKTETALYNLKGEKISGMSVLEK